MHRNIYLSHIFCWCKCMEPLLFQLLRFDLVYNIPIDCTALSMSARTTYYYVALYSRDGMLLQIRVGWMCDSKSWEALESDGWSELVCVASRLHLWKPGFKVKTYGFSKFIKLIEACGDSFLIDQDHPIRKKKKTIWKVCLKNR